MKSLQLLFAAVMILLGFSGCVVYSHEEGYRPRPGYYFPYGYYNEGHHPYRFEGEHREGHDRGEYHPGEYHHDSD